MSLMSRHLPLNPGGKCQNQRCREILVKAKRPTSSTTTYEAGDTGDDADAEGADPVPDPAKDSTPTDEGKPAELDNAEDLAAVGADDPFVPAVATVPENRARFAYDVKQEDGRKELKRKPPSSGTRAGSAE